MHMNMNLSPMTREIEKLREHLSGLINSMIQVQTEQKAELSRIHRSKEEKKTSRENAVAENNQENIRESQQRLLDQMKAENEAHIGERDQQIQLMQEFKQMLNLENQELQR